MKNYMTEILGEIEEKLPKHMINKDGYIVVY